MRCPRPIRPCLVVALLFFVGAAQADVRHEIAFPDPPGYKTLKCDLHMHTVFSDGQVWPTVRVAEAWRLGLDVIAISDHVEHHAYKADVSTNLNRPYEVSVDAAKTSNILLIPAAEITPDTPPGHYNALFLTDANALVGKSPLDAIAEANEQGAFVFWDHHDWKGVERGNWTDFQTTLYQKKWLRGMEVVNGPDYYPRAHQWCLDKNLTMFGNTDIHAPDLNERTTPSCHRPMTLVFAKERTLAGVKEALVQGRTVVWHGSQLIGRQEWLAPLFERGVHVRTPYLRSRDTIWVEIENTSDVDVHLKRMGTVGPVGLYLPARAVTLVKITTDKPNESLELAYTANNFLIAPGKGLPVVLRIAGAEPQGTAN